MSKSSEIDVKNVAMGEPRYHFGPFVFESGRRLLLKNGSPVAIGQRGAAILETLLAAGGQAVSKSALMDAAWQTENIEESNLSVQIAALRKCLGRTRNGDEWIATVQRVGYQFVNPDLAEKPTGADELSAPIAPSGNPSIAVLCFANMSSDPEQDYFADGLAEDLITDLSKVPGLFVVARHSSFAYKGKSGDIRQMANQLGVRYIVEGSVRRSTSRVRINAQLFDATSNTHVWTDRLDRNLTDVFELQDEVVSRIVNALASTLPLKQPILSKRATSLEAYDLFARGRVMVIDTPERNKEGRELLNSAIELEPGFADAHAWVAVGHHFPWANWTHPVELHRSLARAAAERAVFLDPQNAVARGILGIILAYEGKPIEAEAELKMALSINPNHADVWMFIADSHVMQGRAGEGLACARNAFRLNPHPPSFYYCGLGNALYAAGQYEEAIKSFRHESTYRLGSKRTLAASLAQVGRLVEAEVEAKQFLADNPDFSVKYWASTQPFRNERDLQHFIDGYVKAGLPM